MIGLIAIGSYARNRSRGATQTAANLAREDAEKRGQDHAIQVAHLAGAATPDQAKAAIENALSNIANLRDR